MKRVLRYRRSPAAINDKVIYSRTKGGIHARVIAGASVKITARLLKNRRYAGFRGELASKFSAEWLGGMELTEATCMRAVEIGMDISELARVILTSDLLQKYEEQAALIEAENEPRLTMKKAEYDRLIAPFKERYEQQCHLDWVELRREIDPLHAAMPGDYITLIGKCGKIERMRRHMLWRFLPHIRRPQKDLVDAAELMRKIDDIHMEHSQKIALVTAEYERQIAQYGAIRAECEKWQSVYKLAQVQQQARFLCGLVVELEKEPYTKPLYVYSRYLGATLLLLIWFVTTVGWKAISVPPLIAMALGPVALGLIVGSADYGNSNYYSPIERWFGGVLFYAIFGSIYSSVAVILVSVTYGVAVYILSWGMPGVAPSELDLLGAGNGIVGVVFPFIPHVIARFTRFMAWAR